MKISMRIALPLTSIYILLPIVIFLFWWTNIWIGIGVTFGICFLIITQFHKMKDDSFIIPAKTVWLVMGLLFFWTVLSGAGHRGISDGDFYKHNALFSDLISLHWPVRYDTAYLVYYFAYYLPSALIGKWGGWQAGNFALFMWTLLGVSLAFIWLFSFINQKKQLWYGLLFPFFSGLDGLGKLIMRGKVVNNEWEWWGRNWQYSGNTTLFFYVPQHVLIGWLLMGMLFYMLLKHKTLPFQMLLFGASLLWSPFVFLGILPFYLILLVKKQYSPSTIEILISAIICLVEVLFLLSNMTFFTKETLATGWLWETEKLAGSWILVRLALFYLLEFGLFALFIYRFLFVKRRGVEFILFTLSFIILLLIPWYKMGLMNDFAMRSSIPALYAICYFWISTIVETKKDSVTHFMMMAVFFIGSLYSFILFSNSITHFSLSSPRYTLVKLETPELRKQYFGYPNSLFFRLFSSPSIQK